MPTDKINSQTYFIRCKYSNVRHNDSLNNSRCGSKQ